MRASWSKKSVAVAACLLLGLAACGDDDGSSQGGSETTSTPAGNGGADGLQLDEPVKIALLIPRTGSAATPEVYEDAMELALEDLNGAGGVGGHDVEVAIYDTGFSPEDGLTA